MNTKTLGGLDETGFIFMDSNSRPRLCRIWGQRPWLFYWHVNNHWMSQIPLSNADVLNFPRNMTDEQQQYYRDKHQKWLDRIAPAKDVENGD